MWAFIEQVDARLADLDSGKKADKKKIAALNRDRDVLAERIVRADAFLDEIGGQISDGEARELILTKLYDMAQAELDRYLSAEKRGLVFGVENLWGKYALRRVAKIDFPRSGVPFTKIMCLDCRIGQHVETNGMTIERHAADDRISHCRRILGGCMKWLLH